MATTSIHHITQTVGKAIAYITADKVEPILRDDVPKYIKYYVDELTGEVTYKTLVGTLYCTNFEKPENDFEKFSAFFGRDPIAHGSLQSKNGKPILAWHLVQSFEGNANPIVASEIGIKLAEKIFGFRPVVVATHTNTENTHNHIIASAWDYNGKKWHNCHESYREIRNYSDQLCKEYGLSVLDETQNHVLVKWTDNQGKTHYFEPTERKEEIRKKRAENKTYADDVGIYRNSFGYEISEKRRETNVAIVKGDIDEVLPYAKSYDHLLSLLLERDYRIRSRKKNGEWLKNITFTSPITGKGVRDSSIGVEYSRERLTAIIEAQNKEKARNEALQKKLNLPVYKTYTYGEIDVQAINEDYRAYYMRDGSVRIEERSESEKKIICSIKETDRELYGLYDTTYIHRLIEEQRKERKRKTLPQSREETLIRRIQESFDSLRFIESRGICNRQEIVEEICRLRNLIEKGEEKLGKADAAIRHLEKGDAASEYRDMVEELRTKLNAAGVELKRCELCLFTLDRIEREHTGNDILFNKQQKKRTNREFER